MIQTGKVLRIFTNDLTASAQEIADLYKRRWAIELFFRWIKQTLKISHFLGTSENAVRIQIAVALIAFLLLRLLVDANRISKAHSPSPDLSEQTSCIDDPSLNSSRQHHHHPNHSKPCSISAPPLLVQPNGGGQVVLVSRSRRRHESTNRAGQPWA